MDINILHFRTSLRKCAITHLSWKSQAEVREASNDWTRCRHSTWLVLLSTRSGCQKLWEVWEQTGSSLSSEWDVDNNNQISFLGESLELKRVIKDLSCHIRVRHREAENFLLLLLYSFFLFPFLFLMSPYRQDPGHFGCFFFSSLFLFCCLVAALGSYITPLISKN